MKKYLLLLIVIIATLFSACSNSPKNEKELETSNTENNLETTTETKVENNETKEKEVINSVNHMTEREFGFDPEISFEYTGDDIYIKEITNNMLKVAKENFDSQGKVVIPTPYIVKIDDSDKNDIKVYGDFYIYGYEMSGTIFYTKNGGSYPGCYHLKEENGTISTVKVEIAEDGSNNWKSLVKICGDDESLAKDVSNVVSNDGEKNRIEYVKMYAKANNLRVSGIKDYGWPIILFNDIDNASFVYNFFNAYFDELKEEDLLNDKAERINRLKEKYLKKELINKLSNSNSSNEMDMVINAKDVTETMIDTLEVRDMKNGNVEVSFEHDENTKVVANIVIEVVGDNKLISDIIYD